MLALAYRSGEAWNEAAFNNAEFDELLSKALATANADERRVIMERIQQIHAASLKILGCGVYLWKHVNVFVPY